MTTWDNTKLEPVLITFNRADYLEKTLMAFLSQGLQSMRLHVLDNASTDGTCEVVERFQALWPNLQYHCNAYNIGGNANILRAVEISDSEYHWVIGDDDEWFLEHIGQLMTALEEGKADIIRLGWQASAMSRGKLLFAKDLIAYETMFFGSTSMISATILKRTLATKYLRPAYANISNFYPQLIPVILGAQQEALKIYTLQDNLMLHTPNPKAAYFLGDLEWYSIWYKTSLAFSDTKMRARFNQETFHYISYVAKYSKLSLPPLLSLIRICLYFKSLHIKQGRYLLEVFLYGTGARHMFILPAFAYCLTPTFLASMLRDLYRKIHKLPFKKPTRDETR